jgi:ribosomal protein S18 acetylase RimI-like enzyme
MCIIRPAHISDIFRIMEIHQKSMDTHYTKDKFEKYINSTFVSVCNQTTTGFIQLSIVPCRDTSIFAPYSCRNATAIKQVLMLSAIAVDELYRAHGIANSLLSQAILFAKNSKFKYLILQVRENNEHAKYLYKTNGFKEIGIIPKYYTVENGIGMVLFFS